MKSLHICPECNQAKFTIQPVSLAGERNGEEFTVTVEGLHCDGCGYETIANHQSSEFTKAVSDAYRTKNGLLTGAEIKERRAALGMSQLQFAEYLEVGPASVKRWECGQIQDRALDSLIRLKTDPAAARGNLESLENQLGRITVIYGGADVDFSIVTDQPWSDQLEGWRPTYLDDAGVEGTQVEEELAAA